MKIKGSRQVLIAFVITCVFSLAACANSEPTETEMLETISDFGPTQKLIGDPVMMKVEAKKIGCEETAENTYRCGIATRVGNGLVLKYVFTRIDGKWHIKI
ncbi:MAG TPA: hypothetical protein VJ577_15420, partial [Burkholderiaceae bacterium]|nr:hypothetical protein [Burkholderiaceae bacterium]